MTTLDFLAKLRLLGVKIELDGDQLRLSAPKGVLTPDLRAELTIRKAEILAFLRASSAVPLAAQPPLTRIARAERLPLSFAQRRMWFLDQLEPGSPAYNIHEAVRITGPLDMALLARSLNEVIQRHESLRTIFADVDGEPFQVIATARSIDLPVTDLSLLPETEREAEVQRLMVEESRRPFDLARGPLLRAGLLRLSAREHILLLTMHHIVSDGWSIGVLIREMVALQEAISAGKPSSLPELPVQYADYADWQRRWLQGETLEAQLAYWRGQLAGAAVLELPTDHPRPAAQSFRGARKELLLGKEMTAALKTLSQREGATLFMVLLAAFQTLLHRYTGQNDISVGTPIANRNRAEIEGLIGFFVNTLVMRTDFSGDPSFLALLGRVREVALDAYAHQDVPFEKLVEELHPERNLGQSPLFQVMFVLQNAPAPALRCLGLDLDPAADRERHGQVRSDPVIGRN